MMFAAFFKRVSVGAVLMALLIVAPSAYADVFIEDAWVRAVPPNSRTTAAYFVVKNNGSEAQVIDRVSASVAGAAEIHDWIETDGRKTMVRQQQVVVPAGGEVVLRTGSLHMMLFRLEPVPSQGDQVTICVGLQSGADVCAEAVVRHP